MNEINYGGENFSATGNGCCYRSRYSSAALDLGLSQSTISHAIATLEEELCRAALRGRHGDTDTDGRADNSGSQVLQVVGTIQEKPTK